MDTMNLAIGITIVSALIVLSLLIVYLRNYKKIRSTFCSGLIIFALLLLVQNVYAIHVQTAMSGACISELALPILIVNVLEAVGLGALLFITWRPCM